MVRILAIPLCLFTLWEMNYPLLTPQTQLALFAMLGLVICFLTQPMRKGWEIHRAARIADWALALATILCCAYVAVQSEPIFSAWWAGGRSLGARAGLETPLDILVGALGLLLVLEATRRAVGWSLPILSLCFLAYAYWGQWMPDGLFPHRGYSLERIVSQSFLHTQGVFGTALHVMFAYVFLFVLFGALLEATGATAYIIELARRMFLNSTGGAAKIAVVSSGLMGSLSGSAVANTATIGTFTIPMMRSSGFPARVAAGVEATASSGGPLVPPIMGAGAYMMLEIIDPPVTYLQIIQAAILPALFYYVSLLLIVHFQAKRRGTPGTADVPPDLLPEDRAPGRLEGFIFFGSLVCLIGFLVVGYSPFRAVSLAMAVVMLLSVLSSRTRIRWRSLIEVFTKAARGGVALISAAACVGIVVGIVTLTGVGTRLPSLILPMAEQNLLLALLLIMLSSIILGMGLPSAVCYLLMATLIGPVLGQLGVVPLAAHFFIFYFGMMSMVTPPVALAAYTAASIAQSPIMQTGLTAFRYALIGFALPFLFVVHPQLLLLEHDGSSASLGSVLAVSAWTLLGTVLMAGGGAGYLLGPIRGVWRGLLIVCSLIFFFAGGSDLLSVPGTVALLAAVGIVAQARRASRREDYI